MSYFIDLTIPKNTPKDEPVSTEIILLPCTVTKVQVVFPTGCAHLAHVEYRYQEHKMWPHNQEEWFEGNGTVIEFDTEIAIKKEPFKIAMIGYNDDDKYDHTPFTILQVQFLDSYWDVMRTTLGGIAHPIMTEK